MPCNMGHSRYFSKSCRTFTKESHLKLWSVPFTLKLVLCDRRGLTCRFHSEFIRYKTCTFFCVCAISLIICNPLWIRPPNPHLSCMELHVLARNRVDWQEGGREERHTVLILDQPWLHKCVHFVKITGLCTSDLCTFLYWLATWKINDNIQTKIRR